MSQFILTHRIDWEGDIISNSSSSSNSTDNHFKVPTIDQTNTQNTTVSPENILQKREEFIIIYLCIVLLGVGSYLCRSFSFYYMCLRISTNLHDMLFRSVSRAKMMFFNTNPSGRILNRFAKDMYRVDTSLPMYMVDVIDVSRICGFFLRKQCLYLMNNFLAF